MRARITILLICFTSACGNGDDGDETAARSTPCQELRDHLVDLRLSAAGRTPKEMDELRAAFTQALGPDYLANCATNLSAGQVECSLRATDLRAASACTSAGSTTETKQ